MTVEDEFKCWSSDGLGGDQLYAGEDRLAKSYEEFCDWVDPPANTVNWERSNRYLQDTIEEHEYKVKLSNGAVQFDKADCRQAFNDLIRSCDTEGTNSPDNPLGLMYSGRYVRGSTTYELSPKWKRPTQKRADGMRSYKNGILYYEYRIMGKGWAGWDSGKDRGDGGDFDYSGCSQVLFVPKTRNLGVF